MFHRIVAKLNYCVCMHHTLHIINNGDFVNEKVFNSKEIFCFS